MKLLLFIKKSMFFRLPTLNLNLDLRSIQFVPFCNISYTSNNISAATIILKNFFDILFTSEIYFICIYYNIFLKNSQVSGAFSSSKTAFNSSLPILTLSSVIRLLLYSYHKPNGFALTNWPVPLLPTYFPQSATSSPRGKTLSGLPFCFIPSYV